jgi:hypothetical protein
MPTISRFYGITIRMFYNDHAPPHFHAVYGEHELIVAISPISILQGNAPGRVHCLVLEWAALHQAELMEDWDRCRRAMPPVPIDPLV